jgi:putative Mg2+ transporter-C (MgtC) family protein
MLATWQAIWDALRQDFLDLPSASEAVRLLVRLGAAAILGGMLGIERQRMGKAAGLRTHMLVALGAALFVIAPRSAAMSASDLSRVIQGVVTGIGFIGAGAILKLSERREIQGLTTAASVWLTAAVGVAVGLGHIGSCVIVVVMALIILSVLQRFEQGMAVTELGEHGAIIDRPSESVNAKTAAASTANR